MVDMVVVIVKYREAWHAAVHGIHSQVCDWTRTMVGILWWISKMISRTKLTLWEGETDIWREKDRDRSIGEKGIFKDKINPVRHPWLKVSPTTPYLGRKFSECCGYSKQAASFTRTNLNILFLSNYSTCDLKFKCLGLKSYKIYWAVYMHVL